MQIAARGAGVKRRRRGGRKGALEFLSPPWLAGYRIKIVDGNCLEASEHRIEELREATGRALPGKSLVVYEPAQGLVTEVFPCANGHAPERSLFGPLLKTVEAGDLWIEDVSPQ
jgi:hypothetical protein